MDQEDLTNKPETFALGSTFPVGANSNTASANLKRPTVVVWCAQRVRFLRPCTEEFSRLPACFCTPMLHYLCGGPTVHIQP